MSETVLVCHTDGACSGNPGPASIGVVIRQNGKIIKEIAKPIGEATNNIAEYTALIYALQEALMLKASDVKIFTDSELMYKQVIGVYKVKHDNIKQLFEQVRHLIKGLKCFEIQHVPREQNKDADKLATDILKSQAKVVASLFDHSGEESPSSKG